MLKLKVLDELGKPYNIFTDYVESGAIDQFVKVMQQEDVVKGALMPDVHSGYVMPIGGVVATKGTIYPAFVGYDIGCGVSAVQIGLSKQELEERAGEIADVIRQVVPVGFNVHHHNFNPESLSRRVGRPPECIRDLVDSHLNQVATLGGGNHFIEIGYDERDNTWLSIHSGSRGLGHTVASRFMDASGGEGVCPIGVDTQLGRDYIGSLNYC
ncbi:UNVERIFIED_CONTAM: RtcB family protein, partial [Kocuria sp. CPCC 205274]